MLALLIWGSSSFACFNNPGLTRLSLESASLLARFPTAWSVFSVAQARQRVGDEAPQCVRSRAADAATWLLSLACVSGQSLPWIKDL